MCLLVQSSKTLRPTPGRYLLRCTEAEGTRVVLTSTSTKSRERVVPKLKQPVFRYLNAEAQAHCSSWTSQGSVADRGGDRTKLLLVATGQCTSATKNANCNHSRISRHVARGLSYTSGKQGVDWPRVQRRHGIVEHKRRENTSKQSQNWFLHNPGTCQRGSALRRTTSRSNIIVCLSVACWRAKALFPKRTGTLVTWSCTY